MGKSQKIITGVLWGILVLVMVAVVGSGVLDHLHGWRANAQPTPDVLFAAPEFALTDQSNQPFGSKNLRNKVYVADFIFTSCAGVCPMMSKNMSELQKKLPPAVRLVSFTVDPAVDTPAVLKKYAERFGADEERWRFLTGDKQAMFDVAAGMKLSAVPATANEPILHDERFLLIDADGKVRGAYNGKSQEELDKLVVDAQRITTAAGQ